MQVPTNPSPYCTLVISSLSKTLRHVLTVSIIVSLSSLACDDEVPEPPESGRSDAPVRDAFMMLEMRQDYMMSAGTEVTMDMGVDVDSGSVEPNCQQGDIREIDSCGLERCLSGQWVREANARELCNGHDDDCDGQIDESFSIGGMCFADNTDGCRVEGTFTCDPASQAAICMPSNMVSSSPELCDGIDNDCDGQVDEGFDDGAICCSNNIHCPPGVMCIEGLCEENSTSVIPVDNTAPRGTCANPIIMPNFNLYIEDGTVAQKQMAVANCSGDDTSDLILAVQTGFGSEIVFAFTVPTTQTVRFTTELTFFAPVVYVYENNCDVAQVFANYCDQSILGVLGDTPRALDLSFEAQANTAYYVVLDTKVDLVELLELTGGGDLGAIPFILNFSAAN